MLFASFTFAQQNTMHIKASLNSEKKQLLIEQEIVYFNNSNDTLRQILLHNWPNSFKNRKTPLSKRFIKDFRKDLYFAKKEALGFTAIKNISINYNNVTHQAYENKADILEVFLSQPLKPQESTKLNLTYIVQLPSANFTGYGAHENGYRLRYWYITPVIYNDGWQYMSNLNLDDLFENSTNFKIEIEVPKEYVVESNLENDNSKKQQQKSYLYNN